MGRSARKHPLAGRVARLEKLGIEYQLQLAQLVFLVLAALILQELAVGEQFQLAGRCRTWRGSKRGSSLAKTPSSLPGKDLRHLPRHRLSS